MAGRKMAARPIKVKAELYEEISRLAERDGKTRGDVISDAMARLSAEWGNELRTYKVRSFGRMLQKVYGSEESCLSEDALSQLDIAVFRGAQSFKELSDAMSAAGFRMSENEVEKALHDRGIVYYRGRWIREFKEAPQPTSPRVGPPKERWLAEFSKGEWRYYKRSLPKERVPIREHRVSAKVAQRALRELGVPVSQRAAKGALRQILDQPEKVL